MVNRVSVDRDGSLLRIGLNRPEKRNAADFRMLQELSAAYGELDRDPQLRVGVVFAHGDHFTAGLDLADLAQHVGPNGISFLPEGGLDPWQLSGPAVRKPVVLAVQGICYTLGIELALASDIVVAATTTRFAQLEVSRGILPFGGATLRFPRVAGWGAAMRWMLTGDPFDAAEALRMGVVTEVAPEGTQLDRAVELARRIAAQAPLAVQATLDNARRARRAGEDTAAAELQPLLLRLLATEDSRIGMQAYLERRDAEFQGS
jgi:enoyl-CoA hydratase